MIEKGEKEKGEKEKMKGGEGSDGARPKVKCSGSGSEDGGVEVPSDVSGSVRRCMAKEKLDALRHQLGDGRGECISVVLLLVCYFVV